MTSIDATGRPSFRPLDRPLILADGQMDGPDDCSIAGLHVCLFSSRAPDRDGPNQDSAAVIPFGETGAVLAVADGVGGGPSGDRASRLALEALAAGVTRAEKNGQPLRAGVLDGIDAANDQVASIGNGAATTLVVVHFDGSRVRSYHVGDAEAAVIGQRGKIKLQTVSHTPSGLGLEAGLLTAREAIHHEERHLVLNLVGSPDMRVEMGPRLMLAARDTVVLGSDGLFDNWSFPAIVNRVRSGPLAALATTLARGTRARMNDAGAVPSKPDDLTFILARRIQPARER